MKGNLAGYRNIVHAYLKQDKNHAVAFERALLRYMHTPERISDDPGEFVAVLYRAYEILKEERAEAIE